MQSSLVHVLGHVLQQLFFVVVVLSFPDSDCLNVTILSSWAYSSKGDPFNRDPEIGIL